MHQVIFNNKSHTQNKRDRENSIKCGTNPYRELFEGKYKTLI